MVEGEKDIPNLTVGTKDLTNMLSSHILSESLNTDLVGNDTIPGSTD